MKIAICNRRPEDHFGGDLIQAWGYQKALQKLGHEVDYHWELFPSFLGYDYAIMHHVGFGWTKCQYESLKNTGIPYTIVSVFYPGTYPDSSPAIAKEICDHANKIVCFSKEEKDEMIKELGLDEQVQSRMVIVPNGVDKDIFNPTGEKVEMKDFVMSAGRGDELKQFHLVIEACKELDLPVVIATTKWDKGYIERLKGIWDKAVILEGLNQEDLAKWYRACRVYVCASNGERDNLCVKEAAASGATIINSTHNRGRESLSAPSVNPSIKEQLNSALIEAYKQETAYDKEVLDWKDIVKLVI